ncbi:MAG: glycosyltransferase [Kiritimatiellae bacterium]|nr:glycosyltransferase [Kiritimatiellia bacterium]
MTILVVHNRYRQRGGEDSVFESECRMLEDAGHRVIRYEKTNGDIDERGIAAKALLAARTIWNRRTCRDIREILRREKPDVVHCHNTFPLVSPSVYWAAAREGVPVVQTLHNYRLACLNGYLFRDGKICEACLGRLPWGGVCRRCYRGSFQQSAVAFAALAVHRAIGTYRRKVARYVALTDFARGKFAAAGIPAGAMVVKPNVLVEKDGGKTAAAEKTERGGDGSFAFLFLGRLSPEKGVDVLIEAWRMLCADADAAAGGGAPLPRLLVAGDGPEREALEKRAEGLPRLEFLGPVPRENVPALLSRVSALVVPSRCYETFGLTVMEAASRGIASIVSAPGGQASLVEDGKTGMVFKTGDPAALAGAMKKLASDPVRARAMGAAARAACEASACAPGANLAALERIYRSCAGKP